MKKNKMFLSLSMNDHKVDGPLRATGKEQDIDMGADSASLQQQQSVDWSNTSVLFLFPAMCGLLFGYDIGASSGALVSLQSSVTSGTEWGPALSSLQSGAVVSSSLGE
jgi:hypothetical protein